MLFPELYLQAVNYASIDKVGLWRRRSECSTLMDSFVGLRALVVRVKCLVWFRSEIRMIGSRDILYVTNRHRLQANLTRLVLNHK